ncbi:MAG: membrane fusion protein, cobalt-zinc-cadmium efflux system [Methyloprofundus sp.]|nr:MAG: membrane fusion protein, cobalt-zinc-cadmium efflux system [Methyloprofundus sp.]
MKALLMIAILFNSSVLLADEQIKLSTMQLYNLGIKLGKLTPIKSAPLFTAPAKVIIPPANEYMVSTSHLGLINQINVEIGDEVKQGQLLAYLNSPELLALQLHHLKSINDLRLAQADYDRDKKLFDEGIIADRRWLQTNSNYQVFQSHMHETRQLLEISGFSTIDIKALEKSHKLSSQLKIVAPITGVVLARLVTTGERVDALAPLFRVANLNKLWLDISIPQQRIQHISIGDKVLITDLGVSAKIFLIGKSVDEENQTILARAEVETGIEAIRPGQTVSAKIRQSSAKTMFKVPNTALAQYAGENFLFVRTATGFVAKHILVIGREEHGTIITGDLPENSEIAIRGAVALKANFLGLGGDE